MSNNRYITTQLKSGDKTRYELAQMLMLTWNQIDKHLNELLSKKIIIRKDVKFSTAPTYSLNPDFSWFDAIKALSGMTYHSFTRKSDYWYDLIGVNPKDYPGYFEFTESDLVSLSENAKKILKEDSDNTRNLFNMLTERGTY